MTNTPIFPVQKANGKDWRMIQDLRAVNEAVETRAPNGPDPHTLLNSKDSQGNNQSGYAIVQLPSRVVEAAKLPSQMSAQAAELIALTRACKLAKGQSTLTAKMLSQPCFILQYNGKAEA